MDLSDLADSLRRAVAPPGEFATYFPNTTDDDLAGTLADAVAEAMLDGFLSTSTLDIDDLAVLPDLTPPQRSLVVLYAMARVLTARIANLKNRTRYKAGAAEAETEQSASVLVELLRETSARKLQLLTDARAGNVATAFAMIDMYVTKTLDSRFSDSGYGYGGYAALGSRF